MGIKLSQGLKQSQNLAMTPQLQQAIKLLTLTHLEMTAMLSEEMAQNPMLEEIDSESEAGEEGDFELEQLELQNQEMSADAVSLGENVGEALGEVETSADEFSYEAYLEDDSGPRVKDLSGGDSEDMFNYDTVSATPPGLTEHLEWQLSMLNLIAEEKVFTGFLIHNLSDDGLLEGSFKSFYDEYVTTFKENGPICSFEVAYDWWQKILRLDPIGCGAENYQQSLLIQAEVLNIKTPLMELVILRHLEDLKNKNYSKMSKDLGVSVEALKTVETLLQDLHPYPGRLVNEEAPQYIIPDIFVRQNGDKYEVVINDEGIPRLRLSKIYQKMLRAGQEKEYIQDKMRQAIWLIKSIQNRQRTIVRVSLAIVERQQEFFTKGPNSLRPMILKDIADEIGMHESTVSRVTTNKYMHTPRGVFELKYFFSNAIGGKDGGDDVSSEVLKIKIKQLISLERPNKPLSDQRIADLLEEQKITVARRTVAKYREMLDIPSSSIRKKTSVTK
jgi:RNA polymerase sigma-54 factor